MSVPEWGIVIGVVVSALLALGPWMFMVHGKLAVLSAQMARVDAKVEKIVETDQQRLAWCIRHQAMLDEFGRRLGTHDVQLAHVAQRLQEI